MPTKFELHEIKRPIQKVLFYGDTLNAENILIKTINTGMFGKITLTLKLKSGEILMYEGVDQKAIDSLFKAVL